MDVADVGIAIEIDDVQDLGALVEETQVAEFSLYNVKEKKWGKRENEYGLYRKWVATEIF